MMMMMMMMIQQWRTSSLPPPPEISTWSLWPPPVALEGDEAREDNAFNMQGV